jgi:hypothetical protein
VRFLLPATILGAWLSLAAGSPALAQADNGGRDSWPHTLTRASLSATGEFLHGPVDDMPLGVQFGGDVDLVDFERVRVPFAFSFDVAFNDRYNPRHADYGFTFAPTTRVGRADLSVVYHHTSRHLHDQERPGPISWDGFGLRAATAAQSGRWQWRGRVESLAYPASRRRYVDYGWDLATANRVSYRVSPRWAYYADTVLREIWCDPAVAGRAGVTAARVEVGLTLGYRGGVGEAFIGWDRRVDPLPTDHRVIGFLIFGGRFTVSR